jgi:hypothetical protein
MQIKGTQFAAAKLGFMSVSVTPKAVQYQLISDKGKAEYSYMQILP